MTLMQQYMSGAWLSTTRDFVAKYPARCILCRRGIVKGQFMRGVCRYADDPRLKRWAHETCARAAGISAFVGKS